MARRNDPRWIRAILARVDAGATNSFGHRVFATPRARASLSGVLRMLELDALPFEVATRVIINGDGSTQVAFRLGGRQLWVTCDDTDRLRIGRHSDRLGDFYDLARGRDWVGTARNAWAWFLGMPDTWGVYRGRTAASLAGDVCREIQAEDA